MKTLSELTTTFASAGTVRWLGVRPERRAPVQTLESVEITGSGLAGDRYASGGKRAVTLIQHEHLAVIAALAGSDAVDPALLRRNIVVGGINLLGLRKHCFRIGTAILEGTGICAPCSYMEETLGPGGYSAVRGHGGITARVVKPGNASVGNAVSCLPQGALVID